MSLAKQHRTPVAILTGFLGSGKTTLLSRVLHDPGMHNVAVIINEFGTVSIDHRLIARSSEHVIELRNGCVCCTISGDLVMTLRDLHQRRALGEVAAFDYVIIETTGVADPVPLVHTFIANPPLARHYRLDAVIACADAEHLEATLSDHDCGAAQIAMADVVLVTKTDRVTAEALRNVRARVASLNSGAEILDVEHGRMPASRLFRRELFEPSPAANTTLGWLRRSFRPPGVGPHAATYQSHVLTARDPISLAGVSVFLNRLVNRERDRILRVKGVLYTRERAREAAVVHAVRDKFYPVQWQSEQADEDRASHLVVIGRSLDVAWLNEAFHNACVA